MLMSAKSKSTFVWLPMIIVMAGCASKSENTDVKEKKSSPSQPKLSLHRPANFSSAISRLGEIHEILEGKGELPPPRKIEYVEVIHGQGASAHSHYFLASEFQKMDGAHDHDHHDDMEETVKHRFFEVGLRQELEDVARWLPDIAAETDLGESEWSAAKKISEKIQGIVSSASDSSDNQFRDAWRKKSTEVAALLDELKEIAKKTAEELP